MYLTKKIIVIEDTHIPIITKVELRFNSEFLNSHAIKEESIATSIMKIAFKNPIYSFALSSLPMRFTQSNSWSYNHHLEDTGL